jgi:hypothetical protein
MKAKQKFGNLKINNKITGIIFPLNYIVNSSDVEFIPRKISDGRVYTSDVLTSIQYGGSIQNLKDFYYFYKAHRTKEINFKNNNKNFYTADRINNIIKTMKKTIIQMKKIHDPSLIFSCNSSNNLNSNNKLNKLRNRNKYEEITNRLKNSYIFNIDVKKDDKIVIFGDFHGSFHSFYRIFLRLHILNIINFDTYTINDGYKIIFFQTAIGTMIFYNILNFMN